MSLKPMINILQRHATIVGTFWQLPLIAGEPAPFGAILTRAAFCLV